MLIVFMPTAVDWLGRFVCGLLFVCCLCCYYSPRVGLLQMVLQTFAAIAQRGQAAGGPALGAALGGGAAGKAAHAGGGEAAATDKRSTAAIAVVEVRVSRGTPGCSVRDSRGDDVMLTSVKN